jgi:hypothetical protein
MADSMSLLAISFFANILADGLAILRCVAIAEE